MLAHFLAVFLMGAFRGQRKLTWMLGVLSFLTAAVTGLTGFVSLQNFEGQWVATQAKDAIIPPASADSSTFSTPARS
jgi:quinol-cytochrome oxidoreductase complex cytochrome b subunit